MADNLTTQEGIGGPQVATNEIAGVHYARSKTGWGAPGVYNDVDAANPLPVAIPGATLSAPLPTRIASYNYPISTNNSSTTQLAAGASFNGVIESAQDQPSLSILLTSDQPTTIRVRQFIDAGGTFAAPDIFFYVDAGQGFARSLTINGNFCQVIATNTGASATTTFNLNCAFGNLGDADSTGTMPVTELPLVLAGAAAQTAVVNNIIEPTAGANGTRVAGYRAASVQVVSTGTAGTFIFEQSNDGTNWIALPVFNAALVTAVPITAAITATASAIVYTFPIRCNFLRLRIATTITGGSIRAFTRLSTEPWTPAVNLVASNTAANMLAQVSGTVTATGVAGAAAEDAAASGNPVLTGGVVRTAVAPTTLVAGDVARHTMTSGGALVVKQYAPQQVEFSASLALTTTTAAAIAAAGAAGIRNHLTSLWAINTGAAVVDLIILDGATERARYPLPVNVPVAVTFPTGLLTTAATALNANLSAAGTVRANFTGYTSA